MKARLDHEVVKRGLAATRSQAESLIRLGKVRINGQTITKTGYFVSDSAKIELLGEQNYVSRAGLKLGGANQRFKIGFKGKDVLDVGSSTGGFSDYALQKGAKKVLAVEVGTDQMNPKLASDERIELHEKTDIRNFSPKSPPDIVLADLSFISLRQVLPHLAQISSPKTELLVLLKPQFEAGKGQINKGVIKNDTVRRQIFKDFETWVQKLFKIVDKVDSSVPGEKGNLERFYHLKKLVV